jgi:hypothetical protein
MIKTSKSPSSLSTGSRNCLQKFTRGASYQSFSSLVTWTLHEWNPKSSYKIFRRDLLVNRMLSVRCPCGRAIAEAVSHWLPNAASRVWSSGICGGQSGAGAGFLQVLQFPHANLHSTEFSIIINIRGRYNRPFSGRRAEWTHLDSTLHYVNLKRKKASVYHLTERVRRCFATTHTRSAFSLVCEQNVQSR